MYKAGDKIILTMDCGPYKKEIKNDIDWLDQIKENFRDGV